ncbi:MAG: hypothetical protein WC211_03635 [Dehalococcoidia bacterium]
MKSAIGMVGWMRIRVVGADGRVKDDRTVKNLITRVGDQTYMERGAGIGVLSEPTGMRLGTGTTAVAKTGAGAAIVTYIAASAKALDAAASSGLTGSARTITYETTWVAGEATNGAIAEVVLTNESPLTNVAGSAANTVARALISPVVSKLADDSLVVTWTHSGEGA